MLTLTHESTIKYQSFQTAQMNNSRLNTMINANFPQESLHSISNGNLRFTHHVQKLYIKQSTLMTANNIQKHS